MERELTVLFEIVLALWIVAIGFAMTVRGPAGASVVFQWPFVNGFRLFRRILGSLFVSIGRAIHPGR